MARTVDAAEMNFGEEELENELDGEELDGEEDGDEDESDPDDMDSEQNARARGDYVDEEEEDPDLEALTAVAGDGRGNKLYPRIQELSNENKRLRDIVEQAATRGGAAQVEQQVEQAPAFDLKGKIRARAEAQLDGDLEKTVALDEEIENYRLEVATATATQRSQAAMNAQITKDRMDEVVGKAFEKYPFLNDANPDVFDEEALADVVMWRNRFISDGLAPHVALSKATKKVGDAYGGGAGEGDPERESPDKERRARILRNANAASRIPARTSTAGVNGARNLSRGAGKRSAYEIPAKEYANLPEKEKARLRGDIVEG